MTLRILVAGGFGFIGGRLADSLVRAGHHVVLGSRNAVSTPDWLPEAEVVQIEWNDVKALERCCESINVVVHAAGMNAQDCAADPVGALAFNGVATARLVSAASRAGVKRFIYLSTAHVYASPLVGTITEETCPRNLHPYATSHLAGENAVLSACKDGQIQGIVLRLSNVIGPPMHKDANCWMLLVNELCKQAVQKRKLVLKTSGLQLRDFIGMEEFCSVTERLVIGNLVSGQPDIFNLGSGLTLSVMAMAELIQQRSKDVLGFTPVIARKTCAVNGQNLALSYKTNNLAAIGLARIDQVCTADIDNLLRFCQTRFTPSQSSRT